MNPTIELPGLLLAEIQKFAAETNSSAAAVVEEAWRQFVLHAEQRKLTHVDQAKRAEAFAQLKALSGSLKLPTGKTDKELIAEARLEKYGVL